MHFFELWNNFFGFFLTVLWIFPNFSQILIIGVFFRILSIFPSFARRNDGNLVPWIPLICDYSCNADHATSGRVLEKQVVPWCFKWSLVSDLQVAGGSRVWRRFWSKKGSVLHDPYSSAQCPHHMPMPICTLLSSIVCCMQKFYHILCVFWDRGVLYHFFFKSFLLLSKVFFFTLRISDPLHTDREGRIAIPQWQLHQEYPIRPSSFLFISALKKNLLTLLDSLLDSYKMVKYYNLCGSLFWTQGQGKWWRSVYKHPAKRCS